MLPGKHRALPRRQPANADISRPLQDKKHRDAGRQETERSSQNGPPIWRKRDAARRRREMTSLVPYPRAKPTSRIARTTIADSNMAQSPAPPSVVTGVVICSAVNYWRLQPKSKIRFPIYGFQTSLFPNSIQATMGQKAAPSTGGTAAFVLGLASPAADPQPFGMLRWSRTPACVRAQF